MRIIGLIILTLNLAACNFIGSMDNRGNALAPVLESDPRTLAATESDACDLSYFSDHVYTDLKQNCSACHSPGGAGQGEFAGTDLRHSWIQAWTKINRNDPAESRLVVKAGDGHCPSCDRNMQSLAEDWTRDLIAAELGQSPVCDPYRNASEEPEPRPEPTVEPTPRQTNTPQSCTQDPACSVFSRQVYPVFRQNCSNCHIAGGIGPGRFAGQDIELAYLEANSFNRADHLDVIQSKFYRKASNSQHGSGGCAVCGQNFMDSQLAPRLQIWGDEEVRQNGGANSQRVLSTAQNMASIGASFSTVVWDLGNDPQISDPSLAGVEFRMEVRVSSENSGYLEVRNPALVTAGAAVRVEDIRFAMDGSLLDELTYAGVVEVVPTGQSQPAVLFSAGALLIRGSLFSISFGLLQAQ